MSDDIDTEVLIIEVESRSHLWDASDENYKNRDLRSKAWQDITSKVVSGFEDLDEADQKKSIEKVQKRWKTARDAYFKCRNKPSKSGSAAAKKSKYIYQDQLSFLDRVRDNETESNFERPESVSQDMDNDDDQVEALETEDVRPGLSSKIPTFRRKVTSSNKAFEDNLLSLLRDSKEKEEDDDRAFLTSLVPSLKTLNQDQKLLFRTQVLQLIMSIKRGNQLNIQPVSAPPAPYYQHPTAPYNYGPPVPSHNYPNQQLQCSDPPYFSVTTASPLISPTPSTVSTSSYEIL